MIDLNSLSKEELIKLVTQKEEQLRAAEDLAEKRERSNIKFARGVTSLALLLKDVNGSYLAQVEEYLSYADDEEAKKAMKVLYDMISYGIKTIGVTSVQIASFFAHGNEAMKAGETSEQAYAKAQSNLKELRQVRSFTNNVKGIVKLSNAIAKASKTLDASTNATVKTLQEISEINKESEPSPVKEKQTHRGRVNNIENLPEAGPTKATKISATCRECGEPLAGFEDLMVNLKTAMTDFEAGYRQQNTYTIGFCQKCGQVEVFMDPGQDHPLFPDRHMSTKTILSWNQAMCIGIPLERALKRFEQEAGLGSNTGSYSLFDYQRFYLKPLFKALEKVLQQRDVLVCDETPFSCLQDQGRGKLPASGGEAKGKTNYIVALTTADHAPKPITLYYYSPTRSAENIGRILEDYNFETLVTDGYSGYRTILNNRNQDKPILDHVRHQSCLVHLRREILKVVLPSDLFKKLLDKPEAFLMQQLEKLLKADTEGMKLHAALRAINSIFLFEAQKNDGLISPEKARLTQAKLMKCLDRMMMKASEGLVRQKGSLWEKAKDHPAAKPCVYYLNAREDFKTFLENPEIPPCTNKVERAIRGVAILRKNSQHKHSPQYMEAMCIALSIDATLRENGVDTFRWLQDYSQALFKHITAKGITQLWKETGCKQNKFSIRLPEKAGTDGANNPYLPENLTEDFDMKPWLDSIFKPSNSQQ